MRKLVTLSGVALSCLVVAFACGQDTKARSLLLLAAAERELGDVGAADWHLQEALRLSAFPGQLWREMAQLRVALRDWEGAAEAYRNLLRHEPGDERAAWALEQLATQGFLTEEETAGAEPAPGNAMVR